MRLGIFFLIVFTISCNSTNQFSKVNPDLVHNLRGDIRPDRKRYDVGEPITVKYWLTNVSAYPIRVSVVDHSAEEEIPFKGYGFDARVQKESSQHLKLEKADSVFSGILTLAPGKKKLFTTNTFVAEKPGRYHLSFLLEWAKKKKISFQPITIFIRKKQTQANEKDPKLEKALLAIISKNFAERMEARRTVKEYGSKAVPYLIKLLGGPNEHLRSTATKLLEDMKDHSLSYLSRNINHPRREIRSRVVYILGRIGEISVYPLLCKVVAKDSDKNIRYTALTAIARNYNDQMIIGIAISALEDSDLEIRKKAIRILRECENTASIRYGYEPDAAPQIRRQAASRWKKWLQNN